MKKSIILSAAILAAGSVATWLIKKYSVCNSASNGNEPKQRTHHITNSFAKAKQFAMGKG